MKKMICLLVLAFLPLVAGTVTRTVTFERDDLIFYQVNEFDVVELRDYPAAVNPGEPRLPRVVETVIIPAGAIPVAVEVVAANWIDIPGTYTIVPAQPDVRLPMPGKTFVPEEYLPDPDVYASFDFYPGLDIRLNGGGTMNGYRLAHVELFPVRYIPADGVLQMATSMTYRLAYSDYQVSDMIPTVRQREVFGEAVRAIVSNPEDVDFCAPRVGKESALSLVPPGYYEYVVVTEPPMDTVFQRLADWKTKKGIPATVVTVSWINSNYSGYDLQEKIRNFIIDAQVNWGAIYVLLGGSGDQKTSGQNIVPARLAWYCYVDGWWTDSMPSDLYYSDLDGTWDNNGNHVWGELTDNVDMYADVYVSRASLYTVAMAQNFVSKVMTYEKNPPTDYIKKMMLPTAILWSSYNERPMQDSIARMTPSDWHDAKMYERHGTLSRQAMVDSINVGYGLGHWVGHGNENGIYMGGGPYLNSTDADNLVNGDKQGVANCIGCMCGGWDLNPGGDCFAEHLVNRVGGGLIATAMNSRYGFGAWVGYYVPGPSERIDTTFYANIFQADMFHCGQVHAVAKDAWVPYADSGAQYDMTRWCIYELNLFGDPELPLWTDIPEIIAVDYPAVIPIGNQNVDVIVTSSGGPVSNALVCLQKGTETYASGYTNASGLVTLTVEPLTPGYMQVTTTAQNHYPFEDSLFVKTSDYAYVTFLKCSISDPEPGGNNNGELNPGESVEIPLWVRNWGQSQGNDITGTLISADTCVALTDTIKNFGDIPADDSAYTGADGYDLYLAASCPNGHSLLFTLTCKNDVDSTWTSQFSLMVYAPILTYQDYTVVGGNGNSILEPGETADLVVTIENEGGTAAVNVTSTLTTNSSLITINDDSGSFGSIDPGNTGNNSGDPYTVTASSSAPYGSEVDCSIIVQADMYIDTLDFKLVIGELVPSDTGYYYVYYSGSLHPRAPVFEWFELAPPGPGSIVSEITNEDADTVTVPLPFTFTYYGEDYNTIGICSNGFMEFPSSTYRFGSNTGIPSVGGPRAMIAPFWDDLDPSEAGDIYQYYDNAEHRWIIEFYQVDHYGGPGDYETFQVILYDPLYYTTPTGDGEIVVQYLVAMQQTGNTIGIENFSETIGIQYHCNGVYHDGAAPVTDSFALKYTTYGVGIEERDELSVIPVRTMLGNLYPNPFSNKLVIAYQIADVDKTSNPSLEIYDAAGRLDRQWDYPALRQSNQVIWDGKDQNDRKVPAGVYFIHFEANDYTRTEKAILLR